VSERIKKTLISKYSIDPEKIISIPVYTVPPTISDLKFLPTKNNTNFTFLFLGRLVRQKNLPMLIRAFYEVANKMPGSELVIVGKGPEKNNLIKNSLQIFHLILFFVLIHSMYYILLIYPL
jgi:glycosyltransferase involved in cell wall biosynthesis